MCAGPPQILRRFPAGIELGGYKSDLPNVTPQTLKAEYDRILSLASIDVMVQGADPALVEELLLAKAGWRCPQPPALCHAAGHAHY